ncbi:MAG: Ig-like domain-containing protein, partial [Roseibacillus sp.]|nr:Ig-like domain-containing protein [Roseibacillus sp.]
MRYPSRIRRYLGILLPMSLLASAEETQVSFRNDIMPVFSRGGCNTGSCHGHRDGRGEFKLSLWGENPGKDYQALLQGGKRVNRKAPAASKILRKPTLEMEHKGKKRFAVDSPECSLLRQWIEQGAKDDRKEAPRLRSLVVTPETLTLSEPQRSVQLKVEATFANGEKRDVSYWSVYTLSNLVAEVDRGGTVTFLKPGETTVLVRYQDRRVSARLALVPDRPGFVWSDPVPTNYIDEHVFSKLHRLR